MDDDFIRDQIESLAAHGQERATPLGRIMARCWPGGPADRAVPVALSWLRRWRPATASLVIPACTCAAGRCAVCN